MKYMTFNSSCSYAGLANLLAFRGIEATDREIALEMDLPYLFHRDEDGYHAGPMLQGSVWFDLYLRPRGLELNEVRLCRDEICSYLETVKNVMLGLHPSPERKHAVVYEGMEDGKYRFLNNKWEHSQEPDVLLLTGEDLLGRLDSVVTAASLRGAQPVEPDRFPFLRDSVEVFRCMREDIHTFCALERTPMQQRTAMETLFRALLLDAVTMLELLGKVSPWAALKKAQGQLLVMVRENRSVVPGRYLDLTLIDGAIEEYQKLICAHMRMGLESE